MGMELRARLISTSTAVRKFTITAGMLTNASGTDLNSFFWRQVVAKPR